MPRDCSQLHLVKRYGPEAGAGAGTQCDRDGAGIGRFGARDISATKEAAEVFENQFPRECYFEQRIRR